MPNTTNIIVQKTKQRKGIKAILTKFEKLTRDWVWRSQTPHAFELSTPLAKYGPRDVIDMKN